jgi:hypothetical protein
MLRRNNYSCSGIAALGGTPPWAVLNEVNIRLSPILVDVL